MSDEKSALRRAPWTSIGLCLTSAVIVTVVFVASARLTQRPAQARFAVVDLAAIVRANQAKSVATLADKDADPAAKTAALARTRDFGKRLDQEVGVLSTECACVLLMREAVVAGQLEDLTPALLSRLSRQ